MMMACLGGGEMVSGHFGTYLHSQIGTCHGQFGTSVKNNFVITK
jgi:hypothetical protein